MAVRKVLNTGERYEGLAGDAKPTGVGINSTFREQDTGKQYITFDGTNWTEWDMALPLLRDALRGASDKTLTTVESAIAELKTLVVLAAGANLIGKVGVDQTTPGTTNLVATSVVKTIQSELLAITAVAAGAQQKSSILSLTGIKKAAVFIDHGRTATTAFVGAGTEYRVEASQKAAVNDVWRTIASVVAGIAAASEITADGDEAAGQTVIECGATLPAVNDIVFWENATLGLSEWAKVVAIDATANLENFTLQDGLTNAQAAAKLIYNKAEHFVLNLDVEAFNRMRVIVNNNNGSTNVAIKSRVACITEK